MAGITQAEFHLFLLFPARRRHAERLRGRSRVYQCQEASRLVKARIRVAAAVHGLTVHLHRPVFAECSLKQRDTLREKVPVRVIQKREFAVEILLAVSVRQIHNPAVAESGLAQIINRVCVADHGSVVVNRLRRDERAQEALLHRICIG